MLETRLVAPAELTDVAAQIHRHWQNRPHTFWLDSACDAERLGRFSFIGTDPYGLLRLDGNQARLTRHGRLKVWEDDPLEALKRVAAPILNSQALSDDVPFTGGLVGYLSYDLGQRMAGIQTRHRNELGLPEAHFGLYDAVICLDHQKGRLHLISSGLPLTGEQAHTRAAERLAWLQNEVDHALGVPYTKPKLDDTRLRWRHAQSEPTPGQMRSTFTRDAYLQTIRSIQAAIASDQIQQVNLAQRFSLKTPFTGPDLYHRLRHVSPAPFGALLQVGDQWILSSSPERFVLLRGDYVETRPIKGTRPRSTDPTADQRSRQELLSSPKDRLEHIMIVDVERSELERVCVPGSVQVPELMVVEPYRTVYQMVSTVTGRLAPDYDPIDCIGTLFPGGSITGTPKMRSMEMIDELEPVGRGVYTGSIGYLGLGGNIDLNVAIRTMILSAGQAHFHVGGAIVADSKPEEEYEETLDKAEGMVRALLAPELE